VKPCAWLVLPFVMIGGTACKPDSQGLVGDTEHGSFYGYSTDNTYGTWFTDSVYWSSNQLLGVHATFSETRMLIEAESVLEGETSVEFATDYVVCFAPTITIDNDGSGTISSLLSLNDLTQSWDEWNIEFTSRDSFIFYTGSSVTGRADQINFTRATETRTIDETLCQPNGG
jgi:hypothetical protein